MNALARNWWALLLRGCLGVGFGVTAWAWPRPTLAVLVILFGAYAFTDGVFAIVSAVWVARRHKRWWSVAIEGALGILAGLVAFFMPGAAALGLLILVAAWALSTGVFEIVAAVRLRKQMRGEWLLGLSGLLSLVFGVLLIWRPAAGVVALVWTAGAYAVGYGVVMIALSIRLRRVSRIGLEERAPSVVPPMPQPV